MSDEAAPPARPAAPRRVSVRNFIDGPQARKDLAYSTADLSNAMQDQASFRLHYGELLAKASRQVDDLKLTLESAESAVYRRLRDEFTTKGVKISEAMLDKEVASNATIRGIKLAINEAKQIEAVAKAANIAFGDRRDMLIQLGAKDRAEFEGEVRIGVAGASAESLKQAGANLLARRAKAGTQS